MLAMSAGLELVPQTVLEAITVPELLNTLRLGSAKTPPTPQHAMLSLLFGDCPPAPWERRMLGSVTAAVANEAVFRKVRRFMSGVFMNWLVEEEPREGPFSGAGRVEWP